jgi:uroporphyrinogen decarboxylase
MTLETARALGGVGHILNLGHGILQHTPVEHAQLFIETGQQAWDAAVRQSAQRVT